MYVPASASWAMARRRHRDSGGTAGMTAHPRAVRHPTGSARRRRVAGTVRRLPAAGTVGGTGHHATSSSRSAISARLLTTPSRSFRSSIRSSAVGVFGTSVSGSRCTDFRAASPPPEWSTPAARVPRLRRVHTGKSGRTSSPAAVVHKAQWRRGRVESGRCATELAE